MKVFEGLTKTQPADLERTIKILVEVNNERKS